MVRNGWMRYRLSPLLLQYRIIFLQLTISTSYRDFHVNSFTTGQSMNDIMKGAGYGKLLTELKTRIHTAQYAALRAVNKELIALYWDMGKLIEERQKAEGWGKAVVERLSADLRAEFGEKSGFSVQNLWYMRKFYREYKVLPNLQPLAGEISWTKNTLILDRCQNPLQREFYLRASARFGWTRRVLEHQIDNQTYEKYLLNQTSFDNALPQALAAQAKLAVKDHYTFEFLELSEAHEERELESALIANVQSFLTEMGPNFTFVGSQYRLIVEGDCVVCSTSKQLRQFGGINTFAKLSHFSVQI